MGMICEGRLFQARKFDDEKYLPRAESKFSRLGVLHIGDYTLPFSYENGMAVFRFGLTSTLNRFPIRHQKKTTGIA